MDNPSTESGMNPSGICMCGCGRRTSRAKMNQPKRGISKGEYNRYIDRHYGNPFSPRDYIVDEKTGCWVWQRAKSKLGYGRFGTNGGLAHRIYYERENGKIPDGLELDHLCRNHSCVNPSHLEAVTHRENHRRGLLAKITIETAREIRRLYSEGTKQSELARLFGIHPHNVYEVVHEISWKEDV